jgi:tetraacyldisaccharide 4'-kinase
VNLDKRGLLSYILLPVSVVFFVLSNVRLMLYKFGLFKTHDFDIPIVVVGNITVGGSGKTPIVIALIKYFKNQGKKVGVVSRGYGSKSNPKSLNVNKDTSPYNSGDEPLLIATQSEVPVMVNPNRVQAVKDMIATHNVEIIISDDGLQHYAMGRKVEIVVIDGKRRLGNGFFLPSGPLRESPGRLKSVDFLINNGALWPGEFSSNLIPKMFVNMVTLEEQPLDFFTDKKCHAVAGIGYPQRFFDTLNELNIDVLTHSFPDHHHYSEDDLLFSSKYPIIMTAKDCVKCKEFTTDQMWYLQSEADLSDDFFTKLETKL